MSGYDLHHKAAALVGYAGGELLGRTRLQKVAYLSQLAGFSDDFSFEYRRFGPYSQQLADAIRIAATIGPVDEEIHPTDWGSSYSIYKLRDAEQPVQDQTTDDARRTAFVSKCAEIGPIELELAATAAFLRSDEKFEGDVWTETARRKPRTAKDGRLEKARDAYKNLLSLDVPKPLPDII